MSTEKNKRPDIAETPEFIEYKKHLNKFIKENLSEEDIKLYDKLLYQVDKTRDIYYSEEFKTKEEAARDYFNYDSNHKQIRLFEEKKGIVQFAIAYWKKKNKRVKIGG